MKKKDIIEAIYQNTSYQKQVIEDVVNQTFDVLTKGIETEDKVLITGLGTFEKVFQNDYYGVHPITGEKMLVQGNYRVKFTSSKHLKEIINKNKKM